MIKENEKIRNALIQEDILRKADRVKLGYEISEKYNVSEDLIYSFEISLEERSLLKLNKPEFGTHVITGVTNKGKNNYKQKLLSKKAEEEVQKEIAELRKEDINEKRARRSHFVDGIKIWQFLIGITGIVYMVSDLIINAILDKGILDLIKELFK